MRIVYLTLVFLFLLSGLFSQESKPILIINPAGHKGQVRSLLVTADKKQIVTGGFDKTIKVWDIESGEMVREILGEIGPGSNGMIYTMALSPDNKYLAAGGWFGKDDESEVIGDIRVFDFNSGKLLFLLKAHRNVIHALAFTSDSKKLLSADGESNLFLWDIETRKIIRKYSHANPDPKVFLDDEIKSISVHNDHFITADYYGRIKFWDINQTEPLHTDHYYDQIPADGVAWSPDGNYMVAVADTFFTVYDSGYKPVAEGTGTMSFVFVAFSPDSKKILFGCSGRGNDHSISVLSLEDNTWTPYADFEDIDNSVITGAFVDNETFAIAGGNKDEVIVVRLKGINNKPEIIRHMSGKGNIIYAASLSGTKIAFSDKWTENFGFSELNKQFDLINKTFEKPDTTLIWNRPVLKNDNFRLERYRRGDALNGGLMIYNNKIKFDSIPLEFWNGDQHRTFSFVNDFIISGAAYGMMRAYNYQGLEMSRFIGHIGGIEGISVSTDGKRLISASDDRTIKIWSMDKIAAINNNDTAISVADYCKRMKIYPVFKKIFKQIYVETESLTPTKEAWLKVIDKLGDNDYTCFTFKNKFSELFSIDVYPLVSVFVDENGDWIIWNEDGYFTSSKKGSKYVGYHVNQGKDKESKYFPFEQFDLKYNRPDIILKDLSMVTDDVIKAYYLAYQKRLKRMGVNENELSDDIHLPELAINNYNFNNEKQEVTVNLSAVDSKYELDRLNVFVNDVPVYGTQGISIKSKTLRDYSTSLDFKLGPGKNKVQISVLNTKGAESLKETFTVINNSDERPDLYLVSVGVSKYKDTRFNLNFAAKDAKDVVAFFEKCNLYNRVYITEITDEEATREAILNLKSDFLSKAQTKDVVIIFTAGHGVLDNDMNYYFGTYDMDFNNPSSGGIAYEDLEQLLDGIRPLRKLFLMDSCHSGELDKDEYSTADFSNAEISEVKFRDAGSVNAIARNGFGLSQSAQLASELFADLRRGTGATIISSAGGAEFAMEGKVWNNGLFTYCLLSGIKEKTSDVNKDGVILLSEIEDYVYEKVEELSGGKQRPTTRRENLEFDFRIW